MIKSLVFLLLITIAITGCKTLSLEDKVSVEMADGRTATVYLEEDKTGDQRILIVDYRSDTARRKESEVEDDVQRIWQSVRPVADERGFGEALIKYRQPDPDRDQPGDYLGLLFEAEKIENGSWKLKKVN